MPSKPREIVIRRHEEIGDIAVYLGDGEGGRCSPVGIYIFFFNLRVCIQDSPQQEEQETIRSKDTEFAAIMLPRCLVGGGESGVAQGIVSRLMLFVWGDYAGRQINFSTTFPDSKLEK